MIRLLVVLLFLGCIVPELSAQSLTPEDWSKDTNNVPRRKAPFWDASVVNGLIFVPSMAQVNTNGVSARGIFVDGLPLLDKSSFRHRVGRYLGQPMNWATMKALHSEVVDYLRSRGRPIMDAIYPEQDITSGTLQIVVLEGKLGNVIWPDPKNPTNRWVNLHYLTNTISLKPGGPVDEDLLEEDLDWWSRSPFRDVGINRGDVRYRRSPKTPDAADIAVAVDETKPWEVHVGANNLGSAVTGFGRVLAGFGVERTTGRYEHILNYELAGNPDFTQFRANTVDYALLLPWRNTLRLFGYYLHTQGEVETGTGVNPIISGNSYQSSMRYEVPMPRWEGLQSEFSFGLDFKHIGNTLAFPGTAPQDTPWNIFQVVFGYVAGLPDRLGRTTLQAQAFYSPGDVTELNSNAQFNQVVSGSQSEYFYARVEVERLFYLPHDMQLVGRIGTQFTGDTLLPSEQLLLGGPSTVHGFPYGDVNTDRGWFASAEFRSPAFHLFPPKFTPREEGLRFVLFYNYGTGSDVIPPTPPQPASVILSSFGGGVRYEVHRRFYVNWNIALRLQEKGFEPTSGACSDISVVITY